MGETAVRSNERLWQRVKQQVLKGSQGGPAGKWSARKAQLAVKKYKSRGGGYKGKKSKSNSLTKWSREKWGYVSRNQSRSHRLHKGRYLPLVVRKHLSSRSKRAENRRKGTRRGKWVPYGKEVTRLMHKYHIIRSSRSKRARRTSRRKSRSS